jgi:hypothetical protein
LNGSFDVPRFGTPGLRGGGVLPRVWKRPSRGLDCEIDRADDTDGQERREETPQGSR